MEPPIQGNPDGIPVLPWWALVLLGTAGLASCGVALRYLVKRQPRASLLLGAVLLLTALFLTGVKLTDFYFYHRFILAVSIPVILLTAVGLSRLPGRSLTAGALLLYAVLTFPQTRLLLTRSYAPFRETVADLRSEALRLGTAAPIAIGYGLGSHVMQCYEPVMRDIRVNAVEKLQAFISQARRENRPLLVSLGYEGLNRRDLPEGFSLLDDPALFERISVRHGIEPEFTFHLMRLKPPLP